MSDIELFIIAIMVIFIGYQLAKIVATILHYKREVKLIGLPKDVREIID